jgi:hypothetical protein
MIPHNNNLLEEMSHLKNRNDNLEKKFNDLLKDHINLESKLQKLSKNTKMLLQNIINEIKTTEPHIELDNIYNDDAVDNPKFDEQYYYGEDESDDESEDVQEDSEDESEDVQEDSEDVEEDVSGDLEDDDLEDVEEDSEEDSDPENTNSYLLPLQNHITYPDSVILNSEIMTLARKYKKKQFLNPNILSNQLCKFLKVPQGMCLSHIDVSKKIHEYVQTHKLIQSNTPSFVIEMDYNLRRLFGVTENEDYELTYFNLYQFLEPHYRKI